MSTITMPAALRVGAQSFGQERFDLVERSDATGDTSVRLFGPPRWTMGLAAKSGLDLADAGVWEVLLIQLRGSVNVLAAWDVNKPAPLGTARGSPTLSANATAGASSISVTGFTAAGTLKQGDWLQVGTGVGTSQLVKVTADITLNGSGAGSVAVEPPIRKQINSGATVTWDKPLGYYRMQAKGFSWDAVPGFLASSGFACDFLETFAP